MPVLLLGWGMAVALVKHCCLTLTGTFSTVEQLRGGPPYLTQFFGFLKLFVNSKLVVA